MGLVSPGTFTLDAFDLHPHSSDRAFFLVFFPILTVPKAHNVTERINPCLVHRLAYSCVFFPEHMSIFLPVSVVAKLWANVHRIFGMCDILCGSHSE